MSGVPMGPSPAREYVRELAEKFAAVETSVEVSDRLEARDARRDRQNGVVRSREAAENTKRAAMNPDAIRRADIEREVNRHAGLQPTLYARDRRELLAQASDRIAERMVRQQVRDSDPNRLPDRADDRRDDIRLQYDRLMVDDMAGDELAVAANPLLESFDDAATHAEATQAE
jgi:hypothetical protein